MATAVRGVCALLIMFLAGCATDGLYRGLYEGVRVRNQLDAAPTERLGSPGMPADYQQYDTMRKERSLRQEGP